MNIVTRFLIVTILAILATLAGCATTVAGTTAIGETGAADSGAVDAGQADVPVYPRGHVAVTCAGPSAREVLTRTNDFAVRTVTIQVQGRSVEVVHTEGRLGWSGTGLDGFVASERGRTYFNDFKLRNTSTARIKQGPTSLAVLTDRRSAVVAINDAFGIEAGESRTLEVLLDTAAQEDHYHDFTSHWYAFQFGNGRERSIFGAGGIIYTDTGEPVPAEDIEYDDSCFTYTKAIEFQVVPLFADMIADLYRDKFMRYEATVIPDARQSLLPYFVRNEGAEEGLFDGAQIVVRARNNGVELRFSNMASACWLTSLRGDVTYGSGTIRDNDVIFSNLRVPVPGRGQMVFMVRCSYRWPIEAIGNDIELRAGAYWDAFTMISLRDMGRIMGTTELQDNREFDRPESLIITVHQHD